MVNKKITIIITIFFLIALLSNVFAFNLFRPSTWFKSEPKTVPGFGPFDGFGGGRSGGGGAGGGFGDEIKTKPNTDERDPEISEIIPILISSGTCPGRCGEGYYSSQGYPKNLKYGNIIYNGSGAICYKCDDTSTNATRCDPRNGSLLGTLDLSTSAGQIIKSEICPDITIDIDVPYPNIEDLPLEEITITPVEPKLAEIGQIYSATQTMFDCSTTETSTIEERLNLKYNTNNAYYRVDDNEKNYLSYSIINPSNIEISISSNHFDTSYDFIQIKDYASVCFIGDIDIPELNNSKRFITDGEATIINGKVISKLKILPGGRKIEICINRPIYVLSESDKKIDNKIFSQNNVSKTFTIRQKRTLWFSKKIKDITFALNVELDPFGCTENSGENTPKITTNFLEIPLSNGSCYNPQGTAVNGLTGKNNYEKYGFNKLLFIYDTDGINHNYCDYGDKYCDQDQLKVALLKKVELMKEQKAITLDGIIFAKSEDNKIEENTNIYLTDEINKINADNLISSDFTYSENPEEYLNTLITQLNKIPEDLRKFVILDLTFTNKQDSIINSSIQETDIVTRINKISGNTANNYLKQISTETNAKKHFTNPMQDIYSYQITVDSFLRNQEEFKTYLNTQSPDLIFKLKNMIFLKQLIENMKIYYGDTISPTLINTKTYGSLENGLTKDIFTSVQFMNESNKPITLLSNSEVKTINAPGLYLYELVLENDSIKYKVKNTTQEIKNFLDYYNMNRYQEYKQNLLFTNPINAIYKNYIGIPFKYNDFQVGLTQGSATVFSNYSIWNEIQDGYILKIKSNNNGIENISYKNIRPLQINSTSNYSYNYLKPNGRYSDKINKQPGKETIFVFLEFVANNSQLVIESDNELITNIPIVFENTGNKKKYNISNNLRTPNRTVVDFEDLFSGFETTHVGYMLSLIKYNQICFNLNNNQINFWFNPEKMGVDSLTVNSETNTTISQITQSTPTPISNASENSSSNTNSNSTILPPTYQIQGNFLVITNTNTKIDNYVVRYSYTGTADITDWAPASFDRNKKANLNIADKNKIYFKICSVSSGECSSVVEFNK